MFYEVHYIFFSLFPSTDVEVTQPIPVILVVIVSVLHYILISVTGTGHFLNTTRSYACIPLPSMVGGLGLGFLRHPLSRLGGPQAGRVIRAQDEGRQAFLGGEGSKTGWRGIPRAGLSRGLSPPGPGETVTEQLSPMGEEAGGFSRAQGDSPHAAAPGWLSEAQAKAVGTCGGI